MNNQLHKYLLVKTLDELFYKQDLPRQLSVESSEWDSRRSCLKLSTCPRCSAGHADSETGWMDGILTYDLLISPLQEEVGGPQSASLVPSGRPLSALCLSNGRQEAAGTIQQPMQLLREAEILEQGCGSLGSGSSREQDFQDRRR